MEYAPGLRVMTKGEIEAVLADHTRWLRGAGGKRASLDGARLDGARLGGANLAHANLVGASLVGASLVGTCLNRANLDGANFVGANLDGASLNGASLAGAEFVGAKINNDKTAVRILRRATRSCGYEFFLWHCQEGFFIKAGCRFFDMAEARQHWTATRVGTLLADETQDILDMFEKAIERQVQL